MAHDYKTVADCDQRHHMLLGRDALSAHLAFVIAMQETSVLNYDNLCF